MGRCYGSHNCKRIFVWRRKFLCKTENIDLDIEKSVAVYKKTAGFISLTSDFFKSENYILIAVDKQ